MLHDKWVLRNKLDPESLEPEAFGPHVMTTRNSRLPGMSTNQFFRRWSRFIHHKGIDMQRVRKLAENNFVSASLPAPCTNRDIVENIATRAHTPFPIESLADELSGITFVRGDVCFGKVGDVLDTIASDYPNMRWWISDKGLNMALLSPVCAGPASFEALAGALTIEFWKDGLSLTNLEKIATKLDEAGFHLKENLQPAQWSAISAHNQKRSRNPIKTFHQAVGNSGLSRQIRRRLYVARERTTRTRTPTSVHFS